MLNRPKRWFPARAAVIAASPPERVKGGCNAKNSHAPLPEGMDERDVSFHKPSAVACDLSANRAPACICK
jgi:hypothetical protein